MFLLMLRNEAEGTMKWLRSKGTELFFGRGVNGKPKRIDEGRSDDGEKLMTELWMWMEMVRKP